MRDMGPQGRQPLTAVGSLSLQIHSERMKAWLPKKQWGPGSSFQSSDFLIGKIKSVIQTHVQLGLCDGKWLSAIQIDQDITSSLGEKLKVVLFLFYMSDEGQRFWSQTIWVGTWLCSFLAMTLNQLVCFLRSCSLLSGGNNEVPSPRGCHGDGVWVNRQ